MLQLRDYQDNCVSGVRRAYIEKRRAPLLVVPTGGGKTVIFSHIAANTSARGNDVIILVHRIELLKQTSLALHKSGVNHGLINPKFTPNLLAPVQVCSVQTLVKRMHKYNLDPRLIIVDEAHHATAGTWKKIFEYYPKARILGVTATPIRNDGVGLGVDNGGLFDELIMGPQIQELIDKGFLVAPIVYAPMERLNLAGLRIKKGDYDKKQLEERLDKPHITGSAVAHYAKICPGTPAVAFCVSVAHAEHVASEFRQAGFRAFSVDGTTDDIVRDRILSGLGNGTVDVVTSCDLISEGTDIPAIGCGIFLRPTESMGLYTQQGGRTLRPCEGKDFAIILDHVGNTFKHGMLTDHREWTLEGRYKRAGTAGEKGVKVKQCPECYSVHEPVPNCPQCGHFYISDVKELKEVDGELTQMTEADVAAVKRMKQSEVKNAKTIGELETIAAARGYKPGWAKHMFDARKKKEDTINDEIL